jgi:hypothetical protein
LDTEKPYVIVIGVDACEPAEAVMEHALELACSHERSEIHVLSADDEFDPVTCRSARAAPDASRSRLALRLDQRLDDMYRRGRVDCRSRPPRIFTHVARNRPAREIARLATVFEANLVVVVTNARRDQSRHSWIPMAETLTQTTPCQVLIMQSPTVDAVA